MNSGGPLYTIGFTQKTAEEFFGVLRSNGVLRIVDTRLNNTGQLAGFSKKEDLKYFAKTILDVDYVHWEESAPEQATLDAYKKKLMKWDEYAREYESLLQRRRIESQMDLILGGSPCLLCSEAKPHHCHRRLLADYINRHRGGSLTVQHLV
jgi:uncharacterized protein (DUF488 family)